MIHWYTCIEFVIIACFATLVGIVALACKDVTHDKCKGCGECLERGAREWRDSNHFKEFDGGIFYRDNIYYERPF